MDRSNTKQGFLSGYLMLGRRNWIVSAAFPTKVDVWLVGLPNTRHGDFPPGGLNPHEYMRLAQTLSGWWFGTFFMFPYIGNNHPNWLSYFSEGVKPPTSYRNDVSPLFRCSKFFLTRDPKVGWIQRLFGRKHHDFLYNFFSLKPIHRYHMVSHTKPTVSPDKKEYE